MLKAKNVDILHGNLLKNIIIYGFPIILIGLIQNLFNAVDIMVLGFVSSDSAVASVGATSTIINLLVNAFFGLSTGVKIVLSRLIGKGDEEKVKKTVSTSMISSLCFGIIVGAIGVILAPAFLHITKCPTECIDGALIYMRIYLAAAPAIMVYNFGSSVINASGDSQSPLYYMMISGSLNVALNFILCLILPQKVMAVAIATTAAQLAGAILVVRRLLKMDGICHLDIKNISWDKNAFGNILANGLPIALTNSLYPIANLQIQTAVNSLGAIAVAGNSSSTTISGLISAATITPWATATTVFVGQNLGAKNIERVKKSIFYLITIMLICTITFGILGMVFSRSLLSMFVSEAEAIRYGQIRMLYTVLPTFLCGLVSISSNLIQVFGYPTFSSMISIFCVFIFRIIWMQFVYVKVPNFHVVVQCFTVSWLLEGLAKAMFFMYLYFAKFKKGILKKML